jgi:hypothetical protein
LGHIRLKGARSIHTETSPTRPAHVRQSRVAEHRTASRVRGIVAQDSVIREALSVHTLGKVQGISGASRGLNTASGTIRTVRLRIDKRLTGEDALVIYIVPSSRSTSEISITSGLVVDGQVRVAILAHLGQNIAVTVSVAIPVTVSVAVAITIAISVTITIARGLGITKTLVLHVDEVATASRGKN